MPRFWRNNGLSLVLAVMFLTCWGVGQFLTGRSVYNGDRHEHGLPAVTWAQYAASPHFLEATMENWESEFFQMGVYVFITASLFQKGSAESHDPSRPKPQDPPITARSPWPVRKGGWVRRIYSHSLSLAFLSLFAVAFVLHAIGSWRLSNEEALNRGASPQTFWQFEASARFWFESFQNWQSEFLAIFAMVVLSIFLREKNSPESKPVTMPHAETDN